MCSWQHVLRWRWVTGGGARGIKSRVCAAHAHISCRSYGRAHPAIVHCIKSTVPMFGQKHQAGDWVAGRQGCPVAAGDCAKLGQVAVVGPHGRAGTTLLSSDSGHARHSQPRHSQCRYTEEVAASFATCWWGFGRAAQAPGQSGGNGWRRAPPPP